MTVTEICEAEGWWRLGCIERLRKERPDLTRRDAEALVDAEFDEISLTGDDGPFGADES